MDWQPYIESVQCLVDLPHVPAVVGEILAHTEDPEAADIAAVAQLVERDPALVAKLLKVSNSPYYGMRQNVGTIQLALVILGVREVRNILLGVAMADAIWNPEAAKTLPKDFWEHSCQVGGAAKRFCGQYAKDAQEEAFLVGLLHDVGKAAFAQHNAKSYKRAIEAAGSGHRLCKIEDHMFGMSHGPIAAAVAASWNFPDNLVDAIGLHHAINGASLAESSAPALTAAVRLADRAVHLRDDPELPPLGNVPGDEEALRTLGLARVEEASALLDACIAEAAQEGANVPIDV